MLLGIVRRLGLIAIGPVGILAAYHIRARKHNKGTQDPDNTPADVAGPSTPPAPSALATLWTHALRGDARAVRRALREHAVPPDTPHPDTGAPLVLDIAHTPASSEHLDARLADVLRTLARAGWTLAAAEPASGDNALHTLARQEWGCHVYHRTKAVIDADMRNPEGGGGMLAATNAEGMMPEGVAEVHRGDMVAYLHVQRLHAERGGGAGVRPRALELLLSALRSVRDVGLSMGGSAADDA